MYNKSDLKLADKTVIIFADPEGIAQNAFDQIKSSCEWDEKVNLYSNKLSPCCGIWDGEFIAPCALYKDTNVNILVFQAQCSDEAIEELATELNKYETDILIVSGIYSCAKCDDDLLINSAETAKKQELLEEVILSPLRVCIVSGEIPFTCASSPILERPLTAGVDQAAKLLDKLNSKNKALVGAFTSGIDVENHEATDTIKRFLIERCSSSNQKRFNEGININTQQ